MKYSFFALVLIGVLFSSSALAKQVYSPVASGCSLKENITVSATFNLKANSLAEARKIFADQVAKITKFSKSGSKLELQSQNYNINSNLKYYDQDGQPISYSYQISGSSSYKMDDSVQAFKFAEFLIAQKMQISFDSNAYRQGNCSE
jgi:hypothetical protein